MTKSKTVSAPPCPFWRAAATDQRHVDPNAPAPLKADQPIKINEAIEHLAYHGGFSKGKAAAIAELLVIAANKGVAGKIRGALNQTCVLNELSDGLLDKELDTGMLRRVDADGVEHVGEFSQVHMGRMFGAEYASEVTIDGETRLAMTRRQLGAFVDDNRRRLGAGRVHTRMANAEMIALLLGIFGRRADDGHRVITERDVEVFFDKGIFPHARLDARVAEAYPTMEGAAEPNDLDRFADRKPLS